MATTYHASLGVDHKQNSGRSFFKRAFDGYLSARQREANRQILNYLQSLDAHTLRSYGYSDDQIRDILNGKMFELPAQNA
ncbi:MAG: hypothetical protein ACFCUR_15745 [Rhodomicrobiaceae bacterium]